MSERSRDAGDTSAGRSTGGMAGTGGTGGRVSGSGGTIPIPEAGIDDGGIDPYPCSEAANVPKDSLDVGICDFATPPRVPNEPFDPDDGNYLNLVVTRDGEDAVPLPRVLSPDDCLGELGWYFDAAGPETIVLCPAACAFVLKSDGDLLVVYGCVDFPQPPD